MSEKKDCPHCGQDLRLDANAPQQLQAAKKLLEAAKKAIDCLADMHESPCRFDDPTPKDEDIECLACWAFEESNLLGASKEFEEILK